jgi:hypothetical protein
MTTAFVRAVLPGLDGALRPIAEAALDRALATALERVE